VVWFSILAFCLAQVKFEFEFNYLIWLFFLGSSSDVKM
jgi:hypothetical protein